MRLLPMRGLDGFAESISMPKEMSLVGIRFDERDTLTSLLLRRLICLFHGIILGYHYR